jgi:hypothetical protein
MPMMIAIRPMVTGPQIPTGPCPILPVYAIRRKLVLARRGENIKQEEGGGIAIFRNAVDYFR